MLALHSLARTAGWVVGHRLSRDVRTETVLARWLQEPVVTRRQIAVLGSGPAVGATTVTALLALVLARYRAEDVLAVGCSAASTHEAAEPVPDDKHRSGLAERLGVPSLHQPRATSPYSPPGFEPSVKPTLTLAAEGLWVMPHSADQPDRFGITVLDAGTAVGRSDGPPGGSVAGSLGRVQVATSSPAGLAMAWDTLNLLAHGRHPLAPTDILLVERAERGGLDDDHERLADAATGLGVRVARLGYDRHLAAAGALRLDQIADSTRWTLSRLAADLLSAPTRTVASAWN
jgi:hypothetical protein